MAVELDGNVTMRGDTGPGVRVRVSADAERLRLMSGIEAVGDWRLDEIGISVLQEGFNVRAEGEEFVLRTSDDVALAETIGVAAASPRLARLIAARHNPEEPPQPERPGSIRSNLGSVGYALAGALVILGGSFLDSDSPGAGGSQPFDHWLVFVIGGVLMVGTAYLMAVGAPGAQLVAALLLIALIVAFGFLVTGDSPGSSQVTSYALIAGGIVVAVAVLLSWSQPQDE